MIRKFTPADRTLFLAMAKEFYDSPAVAHPVPDSHFEITVSELLRSDAYAECYILESGSSPVGYALLAKTFSQEGGGLCVWLDEFYVREAFRGMGLGTEFLRFFAQNPWGAKRLRLEVEPDNERAAELYAKFGFELLGYTQWVCNL